MYERCDIKSFPRVGKYLFRDGIQSFGKGRETSLLIFSTIIGIRNTATGKEPCFADIKTTAVFLDIKLIVTGHPAKSS